MTLRRRLDRLETRRGARGLPEGQVLFTAVVPLPPEGEAPGPGSVISALVIPRLGGPTITLWREAGEAEAGFRARVETAGAEPAVR